MALRFRLERRGINDSRHNSLERLGFDRVAKASVPEQMAFEVTAGEALSALLGNKLVCMRGGAE